MKLLCVNSTVKRFLSIKSVMGGLSFERQSTSILKNLDNPIEQEEIRTPEPEMEVKETVEGVPMALSGSTSSTKSNPDINNTVVNPESLVPPPPPVDSVPFKLNKQSVLSDFLKQNRLATERINEYSPAIIESNGTGQQPHTLWIGCSDSRISEACLGVMPGEVFTHRNICNIVNSNDFSVTGAIQFAVDVIKVKKIIVCGHTDCGGVWAALSSKRIGGVLDLWLNPVRHVRAQNRKELSLIKDPKEKCATLARLNLINSVQQLKRHPSCLAALKNQDVEIYGLMYDVGTGLLSEVEIPCDDEFDDVFHVGDHDDTEAGGH